MFSMVSETSSVTRSPVAYSNSSMALSRSSSGLCGSGALSKASTCASLKSFGKRVGSFGLTNSALGSSARTFSRCRY
ncbi:Uncharacterised protein [Vibrio cholerae]|nr:Uncharacterised protein [Vibrio cholerae]